MSGDVRVADDPSALEYTATVDGERAGVIRYTREGDTITMVHTEVDPKWEGSGIGSTLVHDALEDVRAHGRRVVPLCPFVSAYIDRHPGEYDDLLLA
jgi:predicted GNAT family acetyltransferase